LKLKSFLLGDHEVTLETGKIARQADAAVKITLMDTVILATVSSKKELKPDQDFFPLTVNYQEKYYATGKIPGGFFKREGRPTEKETLTSRLIDRPIRPMFENGFGNEVQVIATVLSLNPEVDPAIPALIGCSAALAISGLPFNGPLGACKVGYIDGKYVVNPSPQQLEESDLELVVAGTESAVLMVESQAKELSEEIMLGAVMFGHEAFQPTIKAIAEFAADVNKEVIEWTKLDLDPSLIERVEKMSADQIKQAYKLTDKKERSAHLSLIKSGMKQKFEEESFEYSNSQFKNVFHDLEKKIVRHEIISGNKRIDGRNVDEVRDISVEIGILPRTHGSALFTRGETQALVVATLGAGRDAQLIDALEGDYKDPFMLHYNFPPYCVGEVGFMSGPKRREIGHGKLARRAIEAVLPDLEDDYPYVIRVVSEITESNGSSSMASVCGTSLALMDAGVPIKAPVAGVAMGLIKEAGAYKVLSDILGDEDHLGDMDFKVAGTEEGITALQMDIKIDGITESIMKDALAQAQTGRLYILSKMNEVISTSKSVMSEWAPTITTLTIDPSKIRDVIGKGGSVIKGITEETGATIDIDDTGLIKVSAVDSKAGEAALDMIKLIVADVEVGQIYSGKVVKLMDFGAFVTVLPSKDGLVHISEICEERVEKVSDRLSEGDQVKVKVLEIDRQGRIRLSMKGIDQ
jgi:polyribonucleotide nucleotidyltransferase